MTRRQLTEAQKAALAAGRATRAAEVARRRAERAGARMPKDHPPVPPPAAGDDAGLGPAVVRSDWPTPAQTARTAPPAPASAPEPTDSGVSENGPPAPDPSTDTGEPVGRAGNDLHTPEIERRPGLLGEFARTIWRGIGIGD